MLAPEIPRADGYFLKADRVAKVKEGFEGSMDLERGREASPRKRKT
jgi:hypothetical protein